MFNPTSKEGKTILQRCARARECFDRCAQKTGAADGRCELSLARAQGNLKFDETSQAMRSVFPDYYVISTRKVAAARVVEESTEGEPMWSCPWLNMAQG